MKKILVITFLTFLASSSFAGYFEDGEEALRTKDYSSALRKFKASADQGNSMANIKLGNMYDAGLGVTQDFFEAIRYYKLAARQGHVLGYVFVGAMYESGQGVSRNLAEAERWKSLARLCQSRNLKNCENLD